MDKQNKQIKFIFRELKKIQRLYAEIKEKLDVIFIKYKKSVTDVDKVIDEYEDLSKSKEFTKEGKESIISKINSLLTTSKEKEIIYRTKIYEIKEKRIDHIKEDRKSVV